MKVMLFAAGMGTRLKPLTDHMPKALVPVDGHPLLDITLRRLVQAGATEVVINVHHFSDQIISYVHTHDWGIPVSISDETPTLLDTGGGLRHALHLFSPTPDPILIHNVDILSDADLAAFYRRSLQRADVSLMVSPRTTQRYLLFHPETHRLMGWTNIATGQVRTPYPDLRVDQMDRYAFSGIHCISPSTVRLMDTLGLPDKFPIMDFYLTHCRDLHIQADIQPTLRLLDVGKQDTLRQAEAFYREVYLGDETTPFRPH